MRFSEGISNIKDSVRGDNRPFDFHIHSNMSDGTYSPREIVSLAKAGGVFTIAVTDHDNVSGVREAQTAGEEEGVHVISGVEIDTEFECELHIIGLCMNINNPNFVRLLEDAKVHRQERNKLIIERLENIGIPVSEKIESQKDATVTRLNIAKAIVDCSFAQSFYEAFEKYLNKGRAGYVFVERTDKIKAVKTIKEAGGIAVLAHPCKLQCDKNKLVHDLKEAGLDALEIYYPKTTEGQLGELMSLANRYDLDVSSGSDFHGKNRKNTDLGCAYQNVHCLNAFFEKVMLKEAENKRLS
ncbi:MAG: PHP domain-containing protein [Clostridia bacterium]|nr:PHP domain-containing protein [Clostridia bacterium]